MPVIARKLIPLEDRGPLRVMFLLTSMPVGGAETLLVNLVRGMNPERFWPSACCLKSRGPLGDELAEDVPVFHDILRHKYDLRVLPRLTRLFRDRRLDAVIIVGAGDKMFWGRLAARRARVPVVLSALHSTGWPDSIGRLNRAPLMTRWTDGFIGVAEAHGRHLIDVERFPTEKVHVIPNGVDVACFHPRQSGEAVRSELGLGPTTPVIGIVAALRPEKNHALFLQAAKIVRDRIPAAKFLIVGDGPQRAALLELAGQLALSDAVHFLGNRSDVPEVLAAMDIFALTSQIEANPVSILEAMASGKPVVAPRVGSIGESVSDGETGYLTAPGDLLQVADRLAELAADPQKARRMGQAGRAVVVAHWSLEGMVEGYEQLIAKIYRKKRHMAGPVEPSGTVAVARAGFSS
jgi:glycosyltransferase involved in cell wall biosynthesis